jgi:hypothetical protein
MTDNLQIRGAGSKSKAARGPIRIVLVGLLMLAGWLVSTAREGPPVIVPQVLVLRPADDGRIGNYFKECAAMHAASGPIVTSKFTSRAFDGSWIRWPRGLGLDRAIDCGKYQILWNSKAPLSRMYLCENHERVVHPWFQDKDMIVSPDGLKIALLEGHEGIGACPFQLYDGHSFSVIVWDSTTGTHRTLFTTPDCSLSGYVLWFDWSRDSKALYVGGQASLCCEGRGATTDFEAVYLLEDRLLYGGSPFRYSKAQVHSPTQ